MTAAAFILGGALAIAAGRLILWTTLRRGSARAATLEATRTPGGAIEYALAPLDLACRGEVVVSGACACALGGRLLRRLRGLEPTEVVELLRANGYRADLMPGWESGGTPRSGTLVAWRRRLGGVLGANALRERARPQRASAPARDLPRQ